MSTSSIPKKLLATAIFLCSTLFLTGCTRRGGSDDDIPQPTGSGGQIDQGTGSSGANAVSGMQGLSGQDNTSTTGGVMVSGGQQNGSEPGTVDTTAGGKGTDGYDSDALKDPDVQEVLKLFEDLTK